MAVEAIHDDDLVRSLSTRFESVYLEVCNRGYAVLGRSRSEHPLVRASAWQVRPGLPPSYAAYGRYRFLDTLRRASSLAPKRVLEVAAGGAFSAACLQEEGRQIVVNDLRSLEGEREAWTTGDQLHWEGGDFHALTPERLGTFDLVMACEVIEHVAHGDRMLEHLRHFLAPRGTLLLTTPNGAYFRSTLRTHSQVGDFEALEGLQFKPDADGHLFLYTADELEAVSRKAGFSSFEVEFSITPFLSGHGGLRFLPSGPGWARVYLTLDTLARRFGPALRERFCAQLLVLLRAE
jgi:2-polyprenyl-6-hydroxyphenyl methylase/3-demethylubiquinone-9 3-methyltransferase